MEPDGNVVTYVVAGKVPRWESGTGGSRGAYAVMQSDGNVVVYPDGASAPAPGQPNDRCPVHDLAATGERPPGWAPRAPAAPASGNGGDPLSVMFGP